MGILYLSRTRTRSVQQYAHARFMYAYRQQAGLQSRPDSYGHLLPLPEPFHFNLQMDEAPSAYPPDIIPSVPSVLTVTIHDAYELPVSSGHPILVSVFLTTDP